jgi:hypothetical protein
MQRALWANFFLALSLSTVKSRSNRGLLQATTVLDKDRPRLRHDRFLNLGGTPYAYLRPGVGVKQVQIIDAFFNAEPRNAASIFGK